MPPLPTVITTSVVRSAHQGESHGGIYLVNLDSGRFSRKVDWNTCDIDWEGRGGDRGLRGIAFHGHEVFIAASDEIIVYDRDFNRTRSLRNRYLKHCHEIDAFNGRLYISSTGFDSVLVYDLESGRFVAGYCARISTEGKFSVTSFDPDSMNGPVPGDSLHLNSVTADSDGLHIAGHGLPFLVQVDSAGIYRYGKLPPGTHNARPYDGGLVYNHTAENSICRTTLDGNLIQSFPVKLFASEDLVSNGLPEDHARQGFGRGLCIIDDGAYIAAGSSPSTITVYETGSGEVIRHINLTMDVRHAIHGLEVWPCT